MNTPNLDEKIRNLKFIKEEYGSLSAERQEELNEYVSIKKKLTLMVCNTFLDINKDKKSNEQKETNTKTTKFN